MSSKIVPMTYYLFIYLLNQFWFKSCNFDGFRAVTCYIITYINFKI